jgi:hypothetical protein
MKKTISVILLIVMIFSLTACGENSPINKRYTEDRSSQMPDIPISDEKFAMYLSSKVIPLCNSVYTLSMQAQQLKLGAGNVENEIKRVEDILADMQKIREDLMEMKINEHKQEQKQNIIDSLNNLEIQLSSYKTLLSSENLTKNDIQNAIDIITSALDTVKQYAKQ